MRSDSVRPAGPHRFGTACATRNACSRCAHEWPMQRSRKLTDPVNEPRRFAQLPPLHSRARNVLGNKACSCGSRCSSPLRVLLADTCRSFNIVMPTEAHAAPALSALSAPAPCLTCPASSSRLGFVYLPARGCQGQEYPRPVALAPRRALPVNRAKEIDEVVVVQLHPVASQRNSPRLTSQRASCEALNEAHTWTP